jgi:hypothetical protein
MNGACIRYRYESQDSYSTLHDPPSAIRKRITVVPGLFAGFASGLRSFPNFTNLTILINLTNLTQYMRDGWGRKSDKSNNSDKSDSAYA